MRLRRAVRGALLARPADYDVVLGGGATARESKEESLGEPWVPLCSIPVTLA